MRSPIEFKDFQSNIKRNLPTALALAVLAGVAVGLSGWLTNAYPDNHVIYTKVEAFTFTGQNTADPLYPQLVASLWEIMPDPVLVSKALQYAGIDDFGTFRLPLSASDEERVAFVDENVVIGSYYKGKVALEKDRRFELLIEGRVVQLTLKVSADYEKVARFIEYIDARTEEAWRLRSGSDLPAFAKPFAITKYTQVDEPIVRGGVLLLRNSILATVVVFVLSFFILVRFGKRASTVS